VINRLASGFGPKGRVGFGRDRAGLSRQAVRRLNNTASSPTVHRRLSPAALLCILTGLNLVNYIDRFVLNAVRTPLATDLGLNYGQSGRLATAFMLGYFLTSPWFGWLGDRWPRKWLIAAGIAVWSVATVLTGLAGSLAVMVGCRVAVGLGEASYATISPSLIADVYGPARRNNALSIFYAAIPVGAALGYLLGGEVQARWGWRYAFVIAGLPGLVLAGLLLPFAEPTRGAADGPAAAALQRPSGRDVLKLFVNLEYNLVVWGYVAYTFALGAFAFWGPTFFETVHGMATAEADRFFGGVMVVAGLVGTLAGGLAGTAWQRRCRAGYALILGLSTLAAVPVSWAALETQHTQLAMGLMAGAMLLLFLSTGPVNTLILETVPVNVRASAMALSIFLIHLAGDMWSPELVGRIADAWGGDLQRAVLILPWVLLLAAALWGGLALKRLRGNSRTSAARA